MIVTLLGIIALAACIWLVVKEKAFPLAMMALSEGRNTPHRDGEFTVYDVAASVKIFEGSLVVLDSSGNAKPAVTATGLIAVGRAEGYVDNSTGSAGDVQVRVRRGVFQFNNSTSTDEITKAEIGDACYIVDDQTVAKTSGSSTRSVAGYIIDVDDEGVWVFVTPIFSTSAGLLAANNLSDVGTAATARANIGANKVVQTIRATNLVGGDATRYLMVAQVAGNINKIYSVLEGAALAAGNATLTGKINGTAITNGAITITESGSAIGDVDVATPSALKAVSVGDVIEFLVGGSNTATDAFADISVLIET